MVIYLSKQKYYSSLKWLFAFSLFFLAHLFLGTFSSLELFWGLKFLTIVITFFFFKTIIQGGQIHHIYKLAHISFFVILINIIIGLLGYGYAQYARNDIGTRGLFYAGNELGILLIVTSMILLTRYLFERSAKKYLFFSLAFLFTAAMLTTKTAILGQVVVIAVLPLINFMQTKRGFRVKKSSLKFLGFGFLVFFIGLPYLIYFALYEMNLMIRLSYWLDKVDAMTLFFSGRNLLAEDVYNYLSRNSNFAYNLIGYGNDSLVQATGGSTELDPVDFFMLFGIVGVILIYGFFILQLRKGRFLDSSSYLLKPYVKFGIFFLLILSSLSGHVLNSGLAGILIGAFLSMQFYNSNPRVRG